VFESSGEGCSSHHDLGLSSQGFSESCRGEIDLIALASAVVDVIFFYAELLPIFLPASPLCTCVEWHFSKQVQSVSALTFCVKLRRK
jgi:hypothetical protein